MQRHFNKILFSHLKQQKVIGAKLNLVPVCLNHKKQIFTKHQSCIHHANEKPTLLGTSFPKQLCSRAGDYLIREAVMSDKEAVLSIRKGIYGGLDFLPDFYSGLISQPNGKAFLALYADKVVAFAALKIIDEGDYCYVKGFRVCEKHENKAAYPVLVDSMGKWARSAGAFRWTGTVTDFLSQHNRHIMTMYHLIYLMQLDHICLQPSDINQVLPVSFDQVSAYIRSSDMRKYLFPYQRILVDIVPYKLLVSNVALMKEMSSDHTRVFTDVHGENDNIRGLLSFGTLFRAQEVSYIYCIEFYGQDITSIKKHIDSHILTLKESVNGSICFMILSQEFFPRKIANDICLGYGMKRVNCPDTEYPQWNFEKEYVIERDIEEV